MNSQLNNNQENNDQVFSEDSTFRAVFFDSSKRVMQPSGSTNVQESSQTKRARLDSTVGLNHTSVATATSASSSTSNTTNSTSAISPATAGSADDGSLPIDTILGDSTDSPDTPSPSSPQHHHQIPQHHQLNHHTHTRQNSHTKLGLPTLSFDLPIPMEDVQQAPPKSTNNNTNNINNTENTNNILSNNSLKRKHKSSLSFKIRKVRSRSLPNLLFSTKSIDLLQTKIKEPTSATSIFSESNKSTTTCSTTTVLPPPLPPVNIQSLREIDLAEILKNPQLRHDILFDPQLQFRPNLDGERGRRKKITYDKYWCGVKLEIEDYYKNKDFFNESTSRLPNLFQTLRDILISLLPSKDKQTVIDVLDIELIMQQLNNYSLDFVQLAKWLSTIFKSHCAPMRDSWVDEMLTKFIEADEEKSVIKLVEGLRMIFTILEAMKLDVANHQIRILRPVLVETAVEFERDYFLQMIARCKLDISDSIKWFRQFNTNSAISPRIITTQAILSLLSCSKMVSEFPSSLAFDHARLIVLRANVRQVVCLQLCIALFKQLCHQSNNSQCITEQNAELLKKEILALITDDNGNVKWTRNIGAIALQISRRSMNLINSSTAIPSEKTVEFAFSWLIKQTQPSSQVYSLMEQRVFNTIKEKVSDLDLEQPSNNNIIPMTGNTTSTTNNNNQTNTVQQVDEDDISSIASRISLLAKFHWNVFGTYYTSE